MMKEYLADDLASDSSDKRHIRKAKKAVAAIKRPAPKKNLPMADMLHLCLLFLPGLLPLFVNTKVPSTTAPASNAAFTATSDQLAPP